MPNGNTTKLPLVSFTVPGDPRSKGRPRFGRGRTYTPRTTVDAEDNFGWWARVAMGSRRPFKVPMRVEVAFFTRTARRVDSDNLLKLVGDAGNQILWQDDSLVLDFTVTRAVDRERPRTEVSVFTTDECNAFVSKEVD